MSIIGSIALSGLHAAATRIAVSADNTVNVRSGRAFAVEGQTQAGVYEPKRVVQIPLMHGGVRVALNSVPPSALFFADPDSPTGLAAFPDVDLGAELVGRRLAMRDFQAALVVIETEGEMEEVLLDLDT